MIRGLAAEARERMAAGGRNKGREFVPYLEAPEVAEGDSSDEDVADEGVAFVPHLDKDTGKSREKAAAAAGGTTTRGTRLMGGGFHDFLSGLAADARLGRYVAPLVGQTPEVVVLSLAMGLADAVEGITLHPALRLLQRISEEKAPPPGP